MDEREYDQKLSDAALMLAGEVPAGEKRDWLIELSRRFKPKPEYADGTIAWVAVTGHVGRILCRRTNVEWWTGTLDHLPARRIPEERVAKVEPLRVLGDDEIAVPVVTKAIGALRVVADHLDERLGYGDPGAAVLRAYAEAVRAAEAGGTR